MSARIGLRLLLMRRDNCSGALIRFRASLASNRSWRSCVWSNDMFCRRRWAGWWSDYNGRPAYLRFENCIGGARGRYSPSTQIWIGTQVICVVILSRRGSFPASIDQRLRNIGLWITGLGSKGSDGRSGLGRGIALLSCRLGQREDRGTGPAGVTRHSGSIGCYQRDSITGGIEG